VARKGQGFIQIHFRMETGMTVKNQGQLMCIQGNRGSRSCVPGSRNCISCVPRCLLHVHQLLPELSNPNMTSCVPRLVRNCISCIESYGRTKCPTIGRFLHSFIVLYFMHNYTHTHTHTNTHTELFNDIDNTVVITCYCLIFKPY